MKKNNTPAAIIAFANNKGGVGKTTSVAATGALLAQNGYKTLLVDLDAQCSLTECFYGKKAETTVYELMTSNLSSLPDAIIPGTEFDNPIEGLDLIPACTEMEELDSILAGKTNREMLLSRIFRALGIEKHYDVVLIDCPPSLGLLTQNALTAATGGLVVPTTAEFMPLKGLQKIEAKCKELAEYFDDRIGIDAILVTHFNSSKNLHSAVDQALREHFGDTVFETRIRENVRLAECPQRRESIFAYAPESNGALDYTAYFEEFKEKFNL